MALPVWPATIPQIALRAGYSQSSASGHIEVTPMEDGSSIRRRKHLQLWSSIPAKFMLTRAEYATFETFWTVDLNAGTRELWIPFWDMKTNTSVAKRARLSKDGYTGTPVGMTHVEVSLPMEIRDA